MKQLLLIVPFVLFLSSCEQQEVARELSSEQLQDRNGISYAVNETEPYSGRVTSFHPNGQLEAEAIFKNGRQEGLIRSWHENGQLESEAAYVHGQEEGLSRLWYENGQLRIEAAFVNGKQEGFERWWNENGQLEQENKYVNGELVD